MGRVDEITFSLCRLSLPHALVEPGKFLVGHIWNVDKQFTNTAGNLGNVVRREGISCRGTR